MQGYAAVFSMLVRLKRVEQLLRALHAPLMMQPKSTPGRHSGAQSATLRCFCQASCSCIRCCRAMSKVVCVQGAGAHWPPASLP